MTFAIILLFALMLLTAAVLFVGMFSMARGGKFNEKYGNKLMVLRVVCQGAAIGLVALIFLAKH